MGESKVTRVKGHGASRCIVGFVIYHVSVTRDYIMLNLLLEKMR